MWLFITPAVIQSAGVRHPVRTSSNDSSSVRNVPVNSDVYLMKGEENVPADERFFYRFDIRCRISRQFSNWKDRKLLLHSVLQNLVFLHILLLLLLRPFNGIFYRTAWVSQRQKSTPFWILMKEEMMRWQWHQLDHMQVSCTLLQTDNYASTSPLSFYRPDALPAAQPAASKHWRHNIRCFWHILVWSFEQPVMDYLFALLLVIRHLCT